MLHLVSAIDLNFFLQFDYRPLLVSMKTAVAAMVFVSIFGILAAWLTFKVSQRTKSLLDAIFTLPMVMPPTVVGFFLLVILGRKTALGAWLIDHNLSLIFSWPATVIAAAVVSFPLMYKTVRGSFEQIDPDLIAAGRILGFSEFKILLRVMTPLTWPSLAAGFVLAFARAVGEFGATLFVAGNFPGVTQTMPMAVYFAWAGGDMSVAGLWVILIAIFSFVSVFAINKYIERKNQQKYSGI